jgi:hypothetical protein
MKRKIDILLDYIREGNKIAAIKLVASFPKGVTKEEKRIIEIASESYKGKDDFYRSLGIDVEEYKKIAWDIIIDNYSHQLK